MTQKQQIDKLKTDLTKTSKKSEERRDLLIKCDKIIEDYKTKVDDLNEKKNILEELIKEKDIGLNKEISDLKLAVTNLNIKIEDQSEFIAKVCTMLDYYKKKTNLLKNIALMPRKTDWGPLAPNIDMDKS